MNEGNIRERSDFIDALVAEIRPVRPALPWISAIAIWTLGSTLFVALTILMSGSMRAGLEADLRTLRLPLELGFGAATLCAAIAASLEVGVPGAPSLLRLLTPVILTGSLWLSMTIYGEAIPGPTVSMDGKRAHCLIEGVMMSVPPTLLALLLLRQRGVRSRELAGALGGMAAASLPAIGMQLAGMYQPEHALRFHLSPVLSLGLLGALAGHFILPRD
jgi:hypothetical protein